MSQKWRSDCHLFVSSSGSALSHPYAEVYSLPERNLLRWHKHQLSLQERHHFPWNHGCCHHHLLHSYCESQCLLSLRLWVNDVFSWLYYFPFTPQITTGEAYLVYTKRLHSNSQFNQYLSALYKIVGTYLFGAAVSQSLTDLAKFTIGRPRPNFLSVCSPVTCNGYMVQINCTGNPRNVTESRWAPW